MVVIVSRASSYRRALGEALVEAGGLSKDVIVLDADTPNSTGTAAFARKYPGRFVNVGISEQDLVTTAAGLAIAGKVAVASAFAMFLMRAWEQIRNTIARDGLNVKLIGTHSGLQDFMDGASHQCFEDIALMRVLPGFTVLAPADAAATKAIVLDTILNHPGPAYIRLGRDNAPTIYDEGEEFPIGGSKVLEDAGDVVIFSYGPMLGVTEEVAKELRRRGVLAGVVDLYSIKPADSATIVKQAARAGLVVTIEDHRVVGGIGSLVAEVLADTATPRRVLRVGVGEVFGASARSYEQLLEYMGLTPSRISSIIMGEVRWA